MKITPNDIIGSIEKLKDVEGGNKSAKVGKSDFSEILKNSINEVSQLQQQADMAVKGVASGEKVDLQNTMIAIEKADVSFRLMMEVRNKIVEAYQEIMRMQV